MGEVIVFLTGDTYYNSQGISSAVYSIVNIHNGKSICLIIYNGDRHLFRELEDRLFPGQVEGAFYILKSLKLHERILKDQQSEIKVRYEDTSAL